MTRTARRRTAAERPAPGTTYRHDSARGVVALPPEDRRAACLYRHAPDGRYVPGITGRGAGVWLCYRCLQFATALDHWRRAMARGRAA